MATLDDELQQAVADAEKAAQGGPEAFIERLGRKLGMQAGVTSVFGQPVTQGEVTVIPVAKSKWGFGGGAGSDEDGDQGAGAGGGAMTSPVGFIEIGGGRAQFIRTRDPAGYWPLLLCAGVTAWLLLRGLRSLVR